MDEKSGWPLDTRQLLSLNVVNPEHPASDALISVQRCKQHIATSTRRKDEVCTDRKDRMLIAAHRQPLTFIVDECWPIPMEKVGTIFSL